MISREYEFEKTQYDVDKRIADLICDMGFTIVDTPAGGDTKFHRLVKQTESHLIVVTYEVRKRLVNIPTDPQMHDKDFSKKMQR